MAHRQPYIYEFASSSSHGILKDSIPGEKISSTRTPSERTPLLPDEESDEDVEDVSIEWERHVEPIIQGVKTVEVATIHNSNSLSLTLENTGSVARDHLASERTFLAYVRTSLSIALAGVALAQILSIADFYSGDDEENQPHKHERHVEAWARPLGAAAIVIALLVLCTGVVRYFTIQRALVRGRFPVSHVGVGLISVLFCGIIVATFSVIIHARLLT